MVCLKWPMALKWFMFSAACMIWDFECRNGDCVPIEGRCDFHPDCDDYSDEANCYGM